MSVVTEHLVKKRVPFGLVSHDESMTAAEESRAVGVLPDHVLKTLVVHTASGLALVVLPGSRRANLKLVREALGDKHARLATEEELVRDCPGCEIGAVPPLGSLFDAPVLVDPEVMALESVVFAAGRHKQSVRAGPEDVFRGERVEIVPLVQ